MKLNYSEFDCVAQKTLQYFKLHRMKDVPSLSLSVIFHFGLSKSGLVTSHIRMQGCHFTYSSCTMLINNIRQNVEGIEFHLEKKYGQPTLSNLFYTII